MKLQRISFPLLILALLLFLLPTVAVTAPPTNAVKFVILKPSDSTVGTPVTVTIEAQKSNNQVDADYQSDVTLVVSGSATGGGLVDIVNGVGTAEVNDLVAETITLSLSDTESTGLDVSSTREVVFAVAGGNAVWNQQKFIFRDDDGDEITATGFGEGNVGQNANIDGVARGANFRLRFAIKLTDADGTISPRLEFKEGADCTTGDWTTITSGSANIRLRLSDNFDDNATTTQQIAAGPFFTAGRILESTNPASSLSLSKGYSTEYEWSLQTADDVPLGTAYSFRITNDGVALNNYDQCPALTTQSPPAPPSGGGGGGVRPRIVRFSGQAYPESKVEVLFKSSVDAFYYNIPEAAWNVSPEGVFTISYVGLIGGDYFFALRAEDKDDRKTGIWPFSVIGLGDELTAENLLVPPTVGFLRTAVRKGDLLTVMGYAAPESKIEVEVDGWLLKEIGKAENNGFYKVLIPTVEFSFGAHTIQVRQEDKNKKKSDLSLKRTFVVSKLFFPQTDLNSDGIINISDWSIFLSRFYSKDEAERRGLDFNEDGKIDLSDFSIFIRTIRL